MTSTEGTTPKNFVRIRPSSHLCLPSTLRISQPRATVHGIHGVNASQAPQEHGEDRILVECELSCIIRQPLTLSVLKVDCDEPESMVEFP